MPTPDHRRIHELEYELGLRDDAPEPDLTIGPQTAINADAILKETYAPGHTHPSVHALQQPLAELRDPH